MQPLENIVIICYDRKIYVPKCLRRHVIDWYDIYLSHPGGSRLTKTIQEVCYCKCLVAIVELFAKPCKICQQIKNRKTLYGHLSPKNISEIKMWDSVHVDLIGAYIKSIKTTAAIRRYN